MKTIQDLIDMQNQVNSLNDGSPEMLKLADSVEKAKAKRLALANHASANEKPLQEDEIPMLGGNAELEAFEKNVTAGPEFRPETYLNKQNLNPSEGSYPEVTPPTNRQLLPADSSTRPSAYQKSPDELDAQKAWQENYYPQEAANVEEPKSSGYSQDFMDQAHKIFPNLKGMLPGYKGQIPYAPGMEPAEADMPSEVDSEASNPVADEVQAQQASPQQKITEMAATPQSKEPADTSLSDAQRLRNELEGRSSIGKAFSRLSQIAAGHKGADIDTSFYDTLSKQAGQPVSDIAANQEYTKTQMELATQKEKADPNSDISKLARNSLREISPNMKIPENFSAAQVEKIFPYIFQAMSAKSAREDRTIAKTQADASKAESKSSNDFFKTQTGVDKLWKNVQSGKSYVGYNSALNANTLLTEAIANKDTNSKVLAASAFMNYAKLAQGDDSVVRSEDMKVLAGGLNYKNPSEMLAKLSARAGGGNFTPNELIAMKKVVEIATKVKAGILHKELEPAVKRSSKAGYDINESVPQSFLEEINSYQSPEVSKTKVQSKGSVSKATVQEYASKHNISVDAATKLLTESGYVIK